MCFTAYYYYYYYVCMIYGGWAHVIPTHVEAIGKQWSQISHLTFPWVLEIKLGSLGMSCSDFGH